MSGQSKGFGFVEMPNADEAQAAIAATNGQDFMGRPLRANESQPKPRGERPRGGNDGGYGRSGGGGGGGRY
jgi:RNA recognition motif-containing protein